MYRDVTSCKNRVVAINLVLIVVALYLIFSHQNVIAQTTPAKESQVTITSNGVMKGVDLQRSGTYQTKAVRKLNGFLWKSEKLFELNYANNQRYGIPDSVVQFTQVNFSDPIYHDGLIYVGLCLGVGRNLILAVNGETGKPVWTFESRQTLSSPILANGFVYVIDTLGNIFVLNPKDGKEKIKIQLKEQEINAYHSPAVNSGVLFLTTLKGHLLAVDLSTQQIKWTFKGSETLSTLAFDKKRQVFIGDIEGFLRAINIETGKENWNFKIKSGVEDISIDEETVYFKSGKGEIYAVNTLSGEQKWMKKLGGKPAALFPIGSVRTGSAFALYNKTIIFAGREVGSNYLFAISAEDGTTKWQSKIAEPGRDPIIADGVIYLGTLGTFYAIDLNSGKQLWVLESKSKVEGQTVKNVFSSPFVSNGTLYVLTDEGFFYAIR